MHSRGYYMPIDFYNLEKSIVVLTHNPKGDWDDVRPSIEQEQGYKEWKKSINVELGQLVLIYISKGVRRIEYIMKVSKVTEKSLDLQLIEKLDEMKSNLLSHEHLTRHGLKHGTVNFILNNNEELYNYVLSILTNNPTSNTKAQFVQPLNQILYGPPGTGKTYHTITKAIEIIENRVVEETEKRDDLKAKFEAYKQAGQIEFVTFHQSYGYEEFVEGIKAKTTDNGIEYKIEAGIFKKLSKKATVNFEQAQENIIAKKDFDVIFKERVLDKLFEDTRLEIKMKKSSFFIKEIDETHIYFDKSGGDSQHVLLLKNLRAMYEAGENKLIMGGLSQYYNPLLEYLLKDNEIKEEEKEPLKNYILIIDEINRGNISKIFGELITLIEPSKRIGAEEAISVRLPYSNELFGVPSNLYIIGTMNTADRSIALMDTALRRRFAFTEMMPRPEVLDFEIEGLHVKRMLETINKRIEYLYDRDHTIGHAYFMELKEPEKQNLDVLSAIFRDKIIPLLQEYFYDDWEKIRLVLGDNQKNENLQFINIKKDYDTKKLFGDSSHELLDDEATKVYEINHNAFSDIKSYKAIYE